MSEPLALGTADYVPAVVGRGITAFFTTRAAGTQRSTEHRARVAATLGVPVIAMNQVHGGHVARVDHQDVQAPPPVADGLITTSSDIALAVLVADCVPVLIGCAKTRIVAAIHAGRRGVAANIVGTAVEQMRELGAHAGDLRAVIGPAICGSCYEVPEQMRAEIAGEIPCSSSQTSWGTPALDLPDAVQWQLENRGVNHVERIAACTLENRDLFSYRRNLETGRFAGVIRLEK